MTLAELGSEAGLLEAVLALAERQAAAGRAPFAALVVRGGEVVFAAPKELIPSAMGPVPRDVVRLIHAVTSVLPEQTRRGATPMPDARLARPFTVFVADGGGR